MISYYTDPSIHKDIRPEGTSDHEHITPSDRRAGWRTAKALARTASTSDLQLDSPEAAVDHAAYWYLWAEQTAGKVSLPVSIGGTALRLATEPDASYESYIHLLPGPGPHLPGHYEVPVVAGISFRRRFDAAMGNNTSRRFGLDLLYLFGQNLEPRLIGAAANIHPATPEEQLLSRLALDEIVEFSPGAGVRFIDHPVAEQQSQALDDFVADHLPVGGSFLPSGSASV